jgi:hypothetical protein
VQFRLEDADVIEHSHEGGPHEVAGGLQSM